MSCFGELTASNKVGEYLGLDFEVTIMRAHSLILLLFPALAGCDIMRGFDMSVPAPGDLDAVALQAGLQQHPSYVASSSSLWDGKAMQLFFRRLDAHAVLLYVRGEDAPFLQLYSLGIGWRPYPTQVANCVALQLELYDLARQCVPGLPPPQALTQEWR